MKSHAQKIAEKICDNKWWDENTNLPKQKSERELAIKRLEYLINQDDDTLHVIQPSHTSIVLQPDFFKQIPISINVLLTTIGRPSLHRMLSSLQSQLQEQDIITIVSDFDHHVTDTILLQMEFKCKVDVIKNPVRLGHWGHGSRNKYQNSLKGDFIMNADDDDRYVDGAFDKIREVCTEKNKLYIFKHEHHGAFAWHTKDHVVTGNIGTSCGVIPNTGSLPPEWGAWVGGDGNFYEKISKLMPYEFIDFVIYKVGDTQ